MASEKYAAQEKYKKANEKNITLSLNIKTDGDILEKLSSMTNRTAYIKQAIRHEIEREAAQEARRIY